MESDRGIKMENQTQEVVEPKVFTCRIKEDHIVRVFDTIDRQEKESKKNQQAKSGVVIAVVRDGGTQYISYSRCADTDGFDRKKGREIAVGRALRYKLEVEKRLTPDRQRKKLSGRVAVCAFPCEQPTQFHHEIMELVDGRPVKVGFEKILVPAWMLTPPPPKTDVAAEPQVQAQQG